MTRYLSGQVSCTVLVLFLLLHGVVGVVHGGVDLAVVGHIVGLGDLRDFATMSDGDNLRMATSWLFCRAASSQKVPNNATKLIS